MNANNIRLFFEERGIEIDEETAMAYADSVEEFQADEDEELETGVRHSSDKPFRLFE